MNARGSRLLMCLALVFLVVASGSTPVFSQCSVVSTNVVTNSGNNYVYKYLDMSAYCNPTASNNVMFCGPSFSYSTNTLRAIASFAATNPECRWTCDCGPGYTSQSFTIDSNDGLPVELMSFSIEEEPKNSD